MGLWFRVWEIGRINEIRFVGVIGLEGLGLEVYVKGYR
jgi:hypothetical protein